MSADPFTDPRQGRRAMLTLLADGEHPLELRCRTPEARWFKVFCDTPQEADDQAHRLTAGNDVFVGLLPRLGSGGDDQRRYAPGRMLWADCDSDRAVRKLDMFEPAPTLRVRSGGMDGATAKRHAYWVVETPVSAEDVRRHELRLAHHLESDPATCDPGRVMRIPGSRSYKTGRVATVESFTGELHTLDTVTGELEDSPDFQPPDAPHPAKTTSELVSLFAGRYDEGERHARFRSVVGVLIARCPRVPPDVLCELACCWAERHTSPCKDRDELERQFDNLLAQELKRRGLA
jgi:hypothetical protein